jgi:hypothetical protein
VLTAEAETQFKTLAKIRHRSLHFSEKTYSKVRDDALSALISLQAAIQSQFSGFGLQPWFIPGTRGGCFISASAENSPFVKKYYLPACPRVGVNHAYAFKEDGWRLYDYADYGPDHLTDQEFCDRYNSRDTTRLAPTDDPSPPGVTWLQWKLKTV